MVAGRARVSGTHCLNTPRRATLTPQTIQCCPSLSRLPPQSRNPAHRTSSASWARPFRLSLPVRTTPPPPRRPMFLSVHLLFLLHRSRKTNRGLQELIRERGCRVKQVGRGHKRGRPASLTPPRACALVLPVRPSLARLSSDLGAAYGTAKSGVGVASMGVLKPELVMRSIIPVVMAGVIGIYGLIVSVIIVGASA